MLFGPPPERFSRFLLYERGAPGDSNSPVTGHIQRHGPRTVGGGQDPVVERPYHAPHPLQVRFMERIRLDLQDRRAPVDAAERQG